MMRELDLSIPFPQILVWLAPMGIVLFFASLAPYLFANDGRIIIYGAWAISIGLLLVFVGMILTHEAVHVIAGKYDLTPV